MCDQKAFFYSLNKTGSAATAPRDATDIEDGRCACQQLPALEREPRMVVPMDIERSIQVLAHIARTHCILGLSNTRREGVATYLLLGGRQHVRRSLKPRAGQNPSKKMAVSRNFSRI